MKLLLTFFALLLLLIACGQDAMVRERPKAPSEPESGGPLPIEPAEEPVERPARYYYRRAKQALGMGLHEAAIVDTGLAVERDPEHAPSLTLRAMANILMTLDSVYRASHAGEVPDGPLAAASGESLRDFDRLVRSRLACDASGDLVLRADGTPAAVSGELEESLRRAAGQHVEDGTVSGVVAYRLRDFDSARRILAEATASNDATAAAWNALGLVRERLGDLDEALTAYREALDRETPRLDEWFPRGVEPETFRWLPAKAGGGMPQGSSLELPAALESARDDLDRSLELDGKDPRALELRGLVHLLQRRLEEARVDFEEALENAPTRARSWYLLARALHAVARTSDQNDAAVRAWRRACDLDPRYLLVFHAMSSFERPDLDHVLHELKGLR